MFVILLLIKVNQKEQIFLKIIYLKSIQNFFFRKKSAKKQINEKHEYFRKSQPKINFKVDDNHLLSTLVKRQKLVVENIRDKFSKFHNSVFFYSLILAEWESEGTKTKETYKLIVGIVSVDLLPFHIVGKPGFQKLFLF